MGLKLSGYGLCAGTQVTQRISEVDGTVHNKKQMLLIV